MTIDAALLHSIQWFVFQLYNNWNSLIFLQISDFTRQIIKYFSFIGILNKMTGIYSYEVRSEYNYVELINTKTNICQNYTSIES